jgi:hypothetical protein
MEWQIPGSGRLWISQTEAIPPQLRQSLFGYLIRQIVTADTPKQDGAIHQ